MLWKEYLSGKSQQKYRLYKEQRKTVKKIVQEAKRREWEAFGNKMEENSRGNSKLLYKTLKNLRTNNELHIHYIKDDEDNVLTTDAQIIQRWYQYFKTALDGGDLVIQEEQNENVLQTEEEEITLEEVVEALRKLRNGKAAGQDQIKSELFKYVGGIGNKVLHRIMTLAWQTNRIPRDWTVATILPLFKKGDSLRCENYRPISLLNTASKVYELILERRIREKLENTFDDNQSGFRPHILFKTNGRKNGSL